ncbi:MAG: response regulator [Lachnospiraceae bacterium]
MYKILLVDDEIVVREAVKKIIQWEEIGFELIGTCKDGREAMTSIEQNRPDVVVTDICMPFATGIELAKYIYETDPSIKTVILSGYNEFEYAKQAMKYQAMEYILKPVTAKELTDTLIRIHGVLDQESARKISMNKIRSAYSSNLPLMRERYLNSLISTTVKERPLSQTGTEEFHFMLEGPFYCTVLIKGDDFSVFSSQEDVGITLGQFAVYNIANEMMHQNRCGEAVQNQESQTVLLFSAPTIGDLTKCTDKLVVLLKEYIREHLNITLTIAVGKQVHTLSKLPLSYENAKALMEFRFLFGRDNVFYTDDFKHQVPDISIDRSAWADRILHCIKSDDREDINKQIHMYLQEMKDSRLPKDRVILHIQNLVLSVVNLLDNTGVTVTCIMDSEREILAAIPQQTQLSGLEKLLITFCNNAADTLYSEREDYGKRQALLALDYIDKNYNDPNLTLNSVCKYLAISTSYFSMIFKAHTGETFVEALTRKRMEIAKNLLENTVMKNYEISSEVGYSDPHYFSTTFKKHLGMSPSEYAKRNRSKS